MKGICGGTASVDICGDCRNSSDPMRDSCVGCNDQVDSGIELNPCSVCIVATRDDFETYGQDCSGECNGEHQVDSCGNCLLMTDSNWNGCLGCDGIANSNKKENEVFSYFFILCFYVFIF